MNTSLWFGINKDETFYPASLLKLPYAFAAYKLIEKSDAYKNKKYIYTADIASINKQRVSASPSILVVGKGYNMEELVKIMTEHSDNGARDMLNIFVPQDGIIDVFATLGVNLPNGVSEYVMTTEKYSMFLRMLYSASYLNDKNSNTILSLLTKTDFTLGLTNKIPKEVEVAHKWGVVNLPSNGIVEANQQLHDCGIVYFAESPYVLCIMTKGKNQTALLETISEISETIYTYVSKNK